jgi:hypothetical protein
MVTSQDTPATAGFVLLSPWEADILNKNKRVFVNTHAFVMTDIKISILIQNGKKEHIYDLISSVL